MINRITIEETDTKSYITVQAGDTNIKLAGWKRERNGDTVYDIDWMDDTVDVLFMTEKELDEIKELAREAGYDDGYEDGRDDERRYDYD